MWRLTTFGRYSGCFHVASHYVQPLPRMLSRGVSLRSAATQDALLEAPPHWPATQDAFLRLRADDRSTPSMLSADEHSESVYRSKRFDASRGAFTERRALMRSLAAFGRYPRQAQGMAQEACLWTRGT
jgi:hypothetical protein